MMDGDEEIAPSILTFYIEAKHEFDSARDLREVEKSDKVGSESNIEKVEGDISDEEEDTNEIGERKQYAGDSPDVLQVVKESEERVRKAERLYSQVITILSSA